jgi:hypothetical protein
MGNPIHKRVFEREVRRTTDDFEVAGRNFLPTLAGWRCVDRKTKRADLAVRACRRSAFPSVNRYG